MICDSYFFIIFIQMADVKVKIYQVQDENICTYVANIAISIFAGAILFRARNVSLKLVKILCPLIIVEQLAFCGARDLYYQGIKEEIDAGKNERLYRAGFAVVSAFCLVLLNLVHWIYAFKMWFLSKKIDWELKKKTSGQVHIPQDI